MTNRVCFRFSDEPLVSLVYDSEAEDQKLFIGLVVVTPLPVKTEERAMLLTGRKVVHTLFTHKLFKVIISSDEITGLFSQTGAFAFFEEYFMSDYKYISFYSGSAWGNYSRVHLSTNELPVKYIENLADLPEIEFVFETAEAV